MQTPLRLSSLADTKDPRAEPELCIGEEALYTVLVAYDTAARLQRMVVAAMSGQPGAWCEPVCSAKVVVASAADAPGHLSQRLQQPGVPTKLARASQVTVHLL